MTWQIRLRENEACEAMPFLSPDILLVQNIGPELHFDYGLAEPDEVRNRMGLTAKRGLHTAIIIQLFSDRRLREDQDPLDELDPDPRGWGGDSVDVRRDLGEDDLGSWLWTLRRAPLTTETLARAVEYTHLALDPIKRQGAVARFDVRAEGIRLPLVDPTASALALGIDGFSRDGARRYTSRFEVLWDQVAALARSGTR